jgi:AcrR family transcriptional regulator
MQQARAMDLPATKQEIEVVLAVMLGSRFGSLRLRCLRWHAAEARPSQYEESSHTKTDLRRAENLHRGFPPAAWFDIGSSHFRDGNQRRRERGVGSSTTVYHYFPTKKSLALAVIRERVTANLAETWIEPVCRASSAAQGILAVFDAVAKSIGDQTVLGCPVNNLALELSLADPDFQHALREVFWEKAIADRLREESASQKCETNDSAGLATLVVAVFSGAMSLAKAAQSTVPLRTCRRELVRLLPWMAAQSLFIAVVAAAGDSSQIASTSKWSALVRWVLRPVNRSSELNARCLGMAM